MSEFVVNIHEAKTHLSRLIERAGAGERIVIAKGGVPKVTLSLVASQQPRTPGRYAGRIHFTADCFAPMSDDELREIEDGYAGDPMRLAPGKRGRGGNPCQERGASCVESLYF